MKTGWTEKVRQAARGLEDFGLDEMAERLGVQDYKTRRKLINTLSALVKSGEVERMGKASYRWAGKVAGQPSKQEILWRYLRARRAVTVEELQEVAGVTARYGREWLGFLVQQEMVKKAGDRYRLVNDQMEMPRNEGKAERLRALRDKKKAALAALDQVFVAVAEARMAVADLEEG